LPTTDEVGANFRKRFASSLGEIVAFIDEERKQLNENGNGEEQVSENRTEDSSNGQGGTSSGKYFRRCSNVLGVQVENLHEDLESIRSQLSKLHKDISTKRKLSNSNQVVKSLRKWM